MEVTSDNSKKSFSVVIGAEATVEQVGRSGKLKSQAGQENFSRGFGFEGQKGVRTVTTGASWGRQFLSFLVEGFEHGKGLVGREKI